MILQPEIFLNSRWPVSEIEQLKKTPLEAEVKLGKKLIWFTTSGTTATSLNRIKWVGHTPETLLSSAERINKEFSLTAKDRWLKTIPTFHVGGYGILVRAHLAGSQVIEAPRASSWSATDFVNLLIEENIQLTSLVPTQVYQIVKQNIQAPSSLKCVFVGAGALSAEISEQAGRLGWPLIETYGMTETASMIAYKKSSSSDYEPMAGVQLRVAATKNLQEGPIQIATSSLLVTYAQETESGVQVINPVQNGWFQADDLVRLTKSHDLHLRKNLNTEQINMLSFQILGRSNEQVKVLGETVSLPALNRLWEQQAIQQGIEVTSFYLWAAPDLQRGHQIILSAASGDKNLEDFTLQAQGWVDRFNQTVLPFERITQLQTLPQLPRNELGKIQISELKKRLSP